LPQYKTSQTTDRQTDDTQYQRRDWYYGRPKTVEVSKLFCNYPTWVLSWILCTGMETLFTGHEIIRTCHSIRPILPSPIFAQHYTMYKFRIIHHMAQSLQIATYKAGKALW